MKYNKPQLIKIKGKLPPITTNFAPPPVEKPNGEPDDNDIFFRTRRKKIELKEQMNNHFSKLNLYNE